jgi:hypothetical protein
MKARESQEWLRGLHELISDEVEDLQFLKLAVWKSKLLPCVFSIGGILVSVKRHVAPQGPNERGIV